MTKSLMSATFNGDDGQYIELDDAGNNVQIERAHRARKLPETCDGVVVKNEVKVETHRMV
jgi:hypothetical protein